MGELWLNGRNYSGGGGVEITGEASGAIASFEDGSANPLKSLVVDINPVQAGSGTPSPDNVRPISGWSSVEVTVAGKNKFDYSAVTDLSGMSNNNGVFTNTATDAKTMFAFAVQQFNGSSYVTQNMLDISTAGRYSVTFTVSQEITKLRIKHNGSTQDLRLDYPFTMQGTFTVSFTIISANPSIVGGLSFKDVMIESGSTETSYEPYNADTETISLGQTVYGGKLNVTTGELTVTDGYIASYNGETLPSTWISDRDVYAPNTSPTTGAEVVYKLANPTEVTLTPTEVTSLLGNNNIWADSGDSDVVYVRDIDKAFNILWNAVMNSNSGTRSLNLMKGAISETKEDIEEPIKEEETKEGNDENQR